MNAESGRPQRQTKISGCGAVENTGEEMTANRQAKKIFVRASYRRRNGGCQRKRRLKYKYQSLSKKVKMAYPSKKKKEKMICNRNEEINLRKLKMKLVASSKPKIYQASCK
jgi:hypothetical protein